MISILGGRLTMAFVLVLALLIANALVSYRATSTLVAYNERVAQSREVLIVAESLFSVI
jgi:CHASE3 domain sensor protein